MSGSGLGNGYRIEALGNREPGELEETMVPEAGAVLEGVSKAVTNAWRAQRSREAMAHLRSLCGGEASPGIDPNSGPNQTTQKLRAIKIGCGRYIHLPVE